jgi:hypothetical protein
MPTHSSQPGNSCGLCQLSLLLLRPLTKHMPLQKLRVPCAMSSICCGKWCEMLLVSPVLSFASASTVSSAAKL